MIWARNLLFLGPRRRRPRRPRREPPAAAEAAPAHRYDARRLPRPATSATSSPSRRRVPPGVAPRRAEARRAGSRPAPARRLALGPDGHRPVARRDPPVRGTAAGRADALVDRPHPRRTAASPTTSPSGSPAPSSAPRTGRSSSTAAAGSSPGSADQVAANRPYDEIVRELIAGDGLWTDHPATNFVTVTAQPDKKNQPDPVRLAGRVTRAFLGLRLDCAECHDHPFAEWKQADFQGLPRSSARRTSASPASTTATASTRPRTRSTKAKTVVAPTVPFAAELLPEDGTRRERLAAWVTHPKNPYFARATVNRVWALMFGRPLVEPVDNLETGRHRPARAAAPGRRLRPPTATTCAG